MAKTRPHSSRHIVLGGPRGETTVMPLWQWRAITSAKTRIVERTATGMRVTILNDRYKTWTPLLTARPHRATIEAMRDAAIRTHTFA